MNTAQTAAPHRAIATIRRRFEKLELEHLRTHAAELNDEVERLQSDLDHLKVDLEHANSVAMSWRDDCFLIRDQFMPEGSSIGLAMDGSLHVMKPIAAPYEHLSFSSRYAVMKELRREIDSRLKYVALAAEDSFYVCSLNDSGRYVAELLHDVGGMAADW